MKKRLTALLPPVFVLMVLVACGKKPSDLSTAKEQQDSPPAAVADRPLSTSSKQEKPTVTLPAGTPVTVRLQTPVSSAASQPGEIFDAVLDEPLAVDGQTVASRGAAVRGKVTIARHSGRLHHPGELGLTLVSVSVQGQDLPLESSHIYAKGSSHKKRNLALIGGGTGAGALIGGIVSGGTGVLIGSAIGAGGGTAAAYGTGKKDVGFGVERRLTFKLTEPVVVPRAG
jgi:hypothetical protein